MKLRTVFKTMTNVGLGRFANPFGERDKREKFPVDPFKISILQIGIQLFTKISGTKVANSPRDSSYIHLSSKVNQ